MTENTANLVLGYWPYQGRAQPIRYLLRYVKADYSEKLYFEKDDWKKDKKENSKFAEMDLPYLIDQDQVISGFENILNHLNVKFGIDAKSEKEINQEKTTLTACNEILKNIEDLVYDIINFDEKAITFSKEICSDLSKFDAQLKSQNGMTGSRLNGIDFYVFYLVNLISSLIQGSLQKFKNIDLFRTRITKNWGIQEYQRLVIRQKFPFFDQTAVWGTFDKMGPVLATPIAPYATE